MEQMKMRRRLTRPYVKPSIGGRVATDNAEDPSGVATPCRTEAGLNGAAFFRRAGQSGDSDRHPRGAELEAGGPRSMPAPPGRPDAAESRVDLALPGQVRCLVAGGIIRK